MSKIIVTSEIRIIEVTQDNHPPQFVVSQGGEPGKPGTPGASAYEVWLAAGNSGSEQDYLTSLRGEDSTIPGAPGASAYEIAVDNGFVGDEAAWLATLKGEDGQSSSVPGAPGKSAYEVAVDNGFEGDEPAWLETLKGSPAEPAPPSTSTVVMTQDQYDAITPDPNTYYLIIGEGLIVRIYLGSTITWELDGGTPPPQWAVDAFAISDWPDAPAAPSAASGYINLF